MPRIRITAKVWRVNGTTDGIVIQEQTVISAAESAIYTMSCTLSLRVPFFLSISSVSPCHNGSALYIRQTLLSILILRRVRNRKFPGALSIISKMHYNG